MAKSQGSFSEQDFIKFLESDGVQKSGPSKNGRAISLAVGGFAAVFSTMTLPFILPFFRRICIPYVPATTEQVKNVMEALKGSSGKVIDLGSGDGRIVIAAAQNNFHASGVELNPLLAFYSKCASFHAGVHRKVQFHVRDLWKFNLKPYRNVIIFGVENMMAELEKKFAKELDKNAQIIACRFPMPNLKPVKTVGLGLNKVWVYKMN